MLRLVKILWEYFRRFASSIKNAILIFKLRYKYEATIGRGCRISSDFKCGKNISIGNYTTIGRNVYLSDNVIVGGFSSLKNITVGLNSHIEGNVRVIGPGNGFIKMGKESYIGFNITLDTSANIYIGDYVHIGCSLWSHSSAKQVIAGLPLVDKNLKYRPVYDTVIENNVYLGINSAISPGIVIGHHSIVSPNSAVIRSVEPYTLVGGVPAKPIKKLDNFLDEGD